MGIWGRSPRRHQPPSGLVSLCQPRSGRALLLAAVTHALAASSGMQVTGLFDLSPSSLSCREVHEGPPQVHRRSVRGQRLLARRRPARSRFIRGQSLHSAGHAQARRARPAARRGSANEAPRRYATQFPPRPRRYPDISRILATARGFLEPCRGHNVGPPVIFRAADGLFTEDGRPSKSRSKRFGEPLAPAGFRPPYVRNHCYAGAHSGTS